MTLIIAILTAPFTILTFCFALEVFAGLKPLPLIDVAVERPRVAIIVPAHDEESVLSSRLAALISSAKGQASILLVADNCADSTASIARELGVSVIERVDPSRRGKGFALDFAKEHLRKEPPDVVVVIDADCMIDGSSLRQLIACSAGLGRPCQTTNLQTPRPESPSAVKLSTFAFFVKNVIRQRALQRLAGRAHLLGTGMGLPWSIFASADLATGSIVEDLKLGQELAAAGHPPLFVESATVWSNAETARNTLIQRRRWEGGFLQNALRTGPAMIGGALRQADPRLTWAAMDIFIPPLALLMTLDLVALGVGSAIAWLGAARWWPVLSLLAMVLLACLGLGLAWFAGGRRFVSLRDIGRAPFYVIWKLPLYLSLLRRGAPRRWQRTDRRPG